VCLRLKKIFFDSLFFSTRCFQMTTKWSFLVQFWLATPKNKCQSQANTFTSFMLWLTNRVISFLVGEMHGWLLLNQLGRLLIKWKDDASVRWVVRNTIDSPWLWAVSRFCEQSWSVDAWYGEFISGVRLPFRALWAEITNFEIFVTCFFIFHLLVAV